MFFHALRRNVRQQNDELTTCRAGESSLALLFILLFKKELAKVSDCLHTEEIPVMIRNTFTGNRHNPPRGSISVERRVDALGYIFISYAPAIYLK